MFEEFAEVLEFFAVAIRGSTYTGALFSFIALGRRKIRRKRRNGWGSTIAKGKLCVWVSFRPVRFSLGAP